MGSRPFLTTISCGASAAPACWKSQRPRAQRASSVVSSASSGGTTLNIVMLASREHAMAPARRTESGACMPPCVGTTILRVEAPVAASDDEEERRAGDARADPKEDEDASTHERADA